jgi:hypothetical protein
VTFLPSECITFEYRSLRLSKVRKAPTGASQQFELLIKRRVEVP